MAKRHAERGEDPISEADNHGDSETQRNTAAHLSFEGEGDREKDHQRRNKWQCQFCLQVHFVRSRIDTLAFHIRDLLLQIKKSEFFGLTGQKLEIFRRLGKRQDGIGFPANHFPVREDIPFCSCACSPAVTSPMSSGNFHERAQTEVSVKNEHGDVLQDTRAGIKIIHVDKAAFAADPDVVGTQQALLLFVLDFRLVDILRIVGKNGNGRGIETRSASS